MFYRGTARKVPDSRWGGVLDVLEAFGWTYQEYQVQPWDLILEAHVKILKRAIVYERSAHPGNSA
jgi:hypothetical protein